MLPADPLSYLLSESAHSNRRVSLSEKKLIAHSAPSAITEHNLNRVNNMYGLFAKPSMSVW